MNDHIGKLDSLPLSWILTTLGKVVDYGKTIKAEPSDFRGDDWILELEDIEKESSRLRQRITFDQRPAKSTKNQFNMGDVLYSKLRPYLNKVLIADKSGYCTTEIVPISAGKYLDNRFLFYWLRHPLFLAYVEANAHGMSMPRLGTSKAIAAPFVLAPLEEQRRIADQLDTLISRINSCNDRFDAIPPLLERFRQSVLNAGTQGSLTADSRRLDCSIWPEVTLAEVVEDFSYGSSAKSAKSGNVPVLRMGNIRSGELTWDDLVYTSDEQEIKKYKLLKGDVLFNRTNSPELVGKTAVFQGEREAVYAGYLIKIRCAATLLPEFLSYCLGSTAGRDYRASVKTDGVNQSNINAKKLGAFKFKLPPIEEQLEIVGRIQRMLALIRRIEERYLIGRASARSLTPRVISKAFRGELVPQDPNSEPAAVLLQRIEQRSSESSLTPTTPRRRKIRAARAPKEGSSMTKSRHDIDVKELPYLSEHLRRLGRPVTAGELFKNADLLLPDFYKQLAWEVQQGHVKEQQLLLVPSDAS